MKKDVAGLRTLTGGSMDAAAIVAKRTDGLDAPSGSEALLPGAFTGPSFSVASDDGVARARVS